MVKNPPANAGDLRDAGSIPGQKILKEGMTILLVFLLRTPWTVSLRAKVHGATRNPHY